MLYAILAPFAAFYLMIAWVVLRAIYLDVMERRVVNHEQPAMYMRRLSEAVEEDHTQEDRRYIGA